MHGMHLVLKAQTAPSVDRRGLCKAWKCAGCAKCEDMRNALNVKLGGMRLAYNARNAASVWKMRGMRQV